MAYLNDRQKLLNYFRVLSKSKLFEEATVVELEKIIQHGQEEFFQPSAFLIQPDQLEPIFLLILEGRAALWQRKLNSVEEKIAELEAGDYFHRPALEEMLSCQAITSVTTLIFEQAEFESIIYPYLKQADRKFEIQANLSALSQFSWLAHLPLSQLKQIAAACTYRVFEAHEVIIRQENTRNKVYIIISGQVDLWGSQLGLIPPPPQALPLRGWRARRQTGDFFGNATLLEDVPPDVVAIAQTRSEILIIEEAELLNLLQLPKVRHILKQRTRLLIAGE